MDATSSYHINRGKSWILLGVALSISGCTKYEHQIPTLESFEIADGFTIELFVAEPLIADPVDMEIDENGNIYVVEMHGYPDDVSGSDVIKLLRDTNGDGLPDESTIFYDNLVLPTGITRWKKGVIVTEAPDIIYLEDTDGDGYADKKEVLLTGFARSVPDLNVNNPEYGMDNYIYLAHEYSFQPRNYEDEFGDSGNEIVFPNNPEYPTLPKNANDKNVRFRPDRQLLEMTSSYTQFGQTFGPFGHHFLTDNAAHLYHEVIDSRYLDRNKNLTLPESRQYVPDYGIGFDIFPITKNPQHQMLTDVGVITSACGITWYLGGLFPEPYKDIVFTAEPSHNLIHTDIMYNNGGTFGSKRHIQEGEFLASTDVLFRPVNMYIGPDGALYILDYNRKIIEHPDWLPPEVAGSDLIYEGSDRGRIYRIYPNGANLLKFANNLEVGVRSDEELISFLAHENIWWRRTAQRLLVDRNNKQIGPKIAEFVRTTPSAVGRVHGLWTLEGLGIFNYDLIDVMLNDHAAGVRENALKIADRYLSRNPDLKYRFMELQEDPDAQVRFQLMASLGNLSDPDVISIRSKLLFKDINNPWMHWLAFSAIDFAPTELFKEAVDELRNEPSNSKKEFFKNLSSHLGVSADAQSIDKFISIITTSNKKKDIWWQSSSIEGLALTLSNASNFHLSPTTISKIAGLFNAKTDESLRSSSVQLLKSLGYLEKPDDGIIKTAQSVAKDPGMKDAYRIDAISILGSYKPEKYAHLLKGIIESDQPVEVRIAASKALGNISGISACAYFLDVWTELDPKVKNVAIDAFLKSNERIALLLDAVENFRIQASSIGWPRTVKLLANRDSELRKKAQEVLQGNDSNADSIVVNYQEALNLKGNIINGSEIYKKDCSMCHQLSGEHGVNYGPDLSTIKGRDKATIMMDIIKPNRSLAYGYDLWTVQLNDGNTHIGFVSQENKRSITLKMAGGVEKIILKDNINSKSASEISAMPEGLYRTISRQEMADLLEYIKSYN